ncbi:MAG: tyrosine-type recombinase/integrase [Desulfocurvibacter africanus]
MTLTIMGLRKPFQRGGWWYFELDRKRRSLGTQDKSEATRLFNEIKRQYLAGKLATLRDETCPRTFGEFADEYERLAPSFLSSPSTLRSYLLVLGKLKSAIGKTKRLDAITLHDLDGMISEHQGITQASRNNYMRTARAVMAKAVEWEWLKLNPFRAAKEKRQATRIRPYLPPEEVGRYLMSIEDMDLRRMAAAYCASGRRRSELLALRGCDVDMDRMLYRVTVSKTDDSMGWYPINKALFVVFQSMQPLPKNTARIFSRWQHPDTVSHLIKDSLVHFGYGSVSLHGLRATFGVQYLHHGGDMRSLQGLLGHGEYGTTAKYYSDVVPDKMREEADRVKLGIVDLFGVKK